MLDAGEMNGISPFPEAFSFKRRTAVKTILRHIPPLCRRAEPASAVFLRVNVTGGSHA